jgi:hypothetical protein
VIVFLTFEKLPSCDSGRKPSDAILRVRSSFSHGILRSYHSDQCRIIVQSRRILSLKKVSNRFVKRPGNVRELSFCFASLKRESRACRKSICRWICKPDQLPSGAKCVTHFPSNENRVHLVSGHIFSITVFISYRRQLRLSKSRSFHDIFKRHCITQETLKGAVLITLIDGVKST